MYAKLFEELSKERVEFLLLGGGAVSLHGLARMITDIDILLENSSANLARFLSVATRRGTGCACGLVPIGPYGFRSIIADTEGNRLALHPETA